MTESLDPLPLFSFDREEMVGTAVTDPHLYLVVLDLTQVKYACTDQPLPLPRSPQQSLHPCHVLCSPNVQEDCQGWRAVMNCLRRDNERSYELCYYIGYPKGKKGRLEASFVTSPPSLLFFTQGLEASMGQR